MTPAALFPDLRPAIRPVRTRPRALTLDACLDGPVASLSHEAFRAWAYLRLLPRSTSVVRARALLERHNLAAAIRELEAAGFLVSRATPSRFPRRFPSVVPVVLDRDALVTYYRPLVELLARRLSKRLPPSVGLDDLVSEGYVALLKAAQRYDPSTGVPFGAYARTRLTGALLDALRAMDPLSRRDRAEVTAGTKAWEEVSLDVATDVAHDAAADVRAADLASRRVEQLLAALDPVTRTLIRRVHLDGEAVPAVARAMHLATPEARQRLEEGLVAMRAYAADTAAGHAASVALSVPGQSALPTSRRHSRPLR